MPPAARSEAIRRGRRLLLSAVSGLLLAASFPPFDLLLPPFVALVPFILGLRSLPVGARGEARAFRSGVALGLVYFGLLLAWLVPALTWLTPLGPLLYLTVVLLLAVIPGGVGWCVHRVAGMGGVSLILALPLAWTAGEWLRGSLPGGLAFPWLGLGTSLTGHPRIVGVAELVGVRGVTFWLVLVNVLVAELLVGFATGTVPDGSVGERGRRPGGGDLSTTREGGRRAGVSRARTIALALAVAVIVPVGWGLWRAETLPTRPVASLALVRTDVPAGVKETPDLALEVTRSQLRAMGLGDGRRTLEGAALVIWPETTYPYVVPSVLAGNALDEEESGDPMGGARTAEGREGRQREALELARRVAAEERTSLLFGALDQRPATAAGGSAEFNAAFLVDAEADAGAELGSGIGAEEGEGGLLPVTVVYRKRYLVPLVERSPSLLPGVDWTRGPSTDGPDVGGEGRGSLAAGRPAPPVSLPGGSGGSFGVLICFESAFPEASRSYRARGADILVNMTNDVWFGAGDGFLARVGARQHEAHMVMRAVENRMGVARSANGGGTFLVDPVGRVHGRVAEGAALTVGEARTSPVRTLYSRTGDWVGPGSALGILVLLLVGARGSPGGRRSSGRPPG